MNLISVIIVAHKRKTFIKTALDSVLNQTLQERNYEVIIVKNFVDEVIDNYISTKSVRSFFLEDETLSGKLSFAIRHSNGNILCFLEDDDLFLKNKLERVFFIFTSEEIDYFHNQYYAINENGNRIKFKFETPDFNLSCISIRKKIININLLAELNDNIVVDSFFYYTNIEYGGKFSISNEILNCYRVHNSISNSSMFGSFQNFRNNSISISKEVCNEIDKLLKLFKSRKVREFLKNRCIFNKIKLKLMGDNTQVKISEYIYFIFTKPYLKSNLETDQIYRWKSMFASALPKSIREKIAIRLFNNQKMKGELSQGSDVQKYQDIEIKGNE